MDTDDGELNLVTEKIIGCAFKVANALGCGFAEKVYENAMVHELRKAGLGVEQQKCITVVYDDVAAGEYLAATGIPLCPLMSFAKNRGKTI